MKHVARPLLSLSALAVLCASLCGSPAPIASDVCAQQPCALADEPPPEPMDCPMCAGDARLHFKRLRAIVRVGEVALEVALGTR